MKQNRCFYSCAIAISILLLIISCQSSPDKTRQVVSSQEMQELKKLDTVQFIDVRTVEEFKNEHIKGATNLVYDEDFESKIDQLDKLKPVAIYCRSGNRTKKSSKILKDAGFKKIYELEGGIIKWKQENYPTIQEEN